MFSSRDIWGLENGLKNYPNYHKLSIIITATQEKFYIKCKKNKCFTVKLIKK